MKLFFNHRLSPAYAKATAGRRTTLTNVRVGRARIPAAPNAPALVLRLFGCAKYIRKVSLMLACMLCAFALNAATWYVDAANGSDENAGTSWEISLATIQSAVDKSSSGDTILVGDGEYASFTLYDPKIDYHGGYKQLSIKTVGGPKKTTINAGEVKIGDGYYSSDVTGSSSLEGFTLKGGSFSVKGPGTIKRCIITQVNGAHAVHYCKVYNGIFYENAVSDSELIGAKLYNCTIYENHGKYIAYDSLGGALHNCIYYGNNLGVYDGAGGAWRNYEYNCFSADPKFVDLDAGDFRLLPTSPCIDAGNNSYATSDDTDVAGKPRINGGTVDIGAYEYYPVELSLKGITAKQRYPWNGKVDVQFKLETSDSNNCVVMLFAKDVAGGTNLPMRTVYKLDGTAVNMAGESLPSGTYSWVWDAAADLPDGFECERVTVTGTADIAPFPYSVKFNANGGTGTMADESFTYGTAKALTANAFTRTDYTFQGWATSASGAKVYNDKQSVSNLTQTSGAVVNLYAVWKVVRGKVQLWEGGPYWAETNIGAEKPEDRGYYFWWGDTIGYKRENSKWVATDGSSSDFSFSSPTPTHNKSIDTLRSEGWITTGEVLAPEHDAAHIHWGGSWRMPTDQEFDDLRSKCDWTWTTKNYVAGYVVKGKGAYASESIFLPVAGYAQTTSLLYQDSFGYYWSSVPGSYDDEAIGLKFYSARPGPDYHARGQGLTVRPVQ